MHTAQKTPAGEALRGLLPGANDPLDMIDLACHTAFLVHDRDIGQALVDVVKTDPELAAGLIITLGALVDVDKRPADSLAWLGTIDGSREDTVRVAGALAEARDEYDDAAADTLPPVTLQSIRDMIHAARLAGVAQPCGTPAGWRRHRKRSQQPCGRCRTAYQLYTHASDEERSRLREPLTVPGVTPRLCDHPPRRCGTLAGYEAHLFVEDPPCGSCRAVVAEMLEDLLPPPPGCGTAAGYDQHLKRDEVPCPVCQQALAEILAGVPLLPPRPHRGCGSPSGYNVHRRLGEMPCEPCRVARSEYDAARYARERRQREKLPPTMRPSCGSHAGYNAHTKNNELPCDPCRAAQSEYDEARHARRLAEQGRTKVERQPTRFRLDTSGRDERWREWPDAIVQEAFALVAGQNPA